MILAHLSKIPSRRVQAKVAAALAMEKAALACLCIAVGVFFSAMAYCRQLLETVAQARVQLLSVRALMALSRPLPPHAK